MKSLIVATLIVFSLNGLADCKNEQRTQRLTHALDLSEEQAGQVESILTARADERKQLHEALRDIHEQNVEQLREVLDPEQLERFERLQERRKDKRQGFKGGRGSRTDEI